ncbi:MAG: penicillin-binding protein activator [Pseudomonadota bacterium]
MKNKILAVFITCLFTLTGCAQYQTAPWGFPTSTDRAPLDTSTLPLSSNEKVDVAILLPLTGKNAALGESMLQAAQLALFETNRTNFNLIPRDTKGTASGASAAAQAAIQQGAQLILGPVFADSVRAVKPIAQTNNVNVIAFSTDWTLADSSTYLMGFMPFSQVDRIANYAALSGKRQVSIIATRDVYGDMVTRQFNDAAKRYGINIEQTVRITPNDPELGTKITEMNHNISAVFMPVGGKTASVIADYLEQNNMPASNVKRLGTGLWNNQTIASVRGLQDGWFAGPSIQKRGFFSNMYQRTYGQSPVQIASLAFDATALAIALSHNGANGFTAGAITDPNGFAGADGVFRFNRNGIVERKLAILQLDNGRIIEIDPADNRF